MRPRKIRLVVKLAGFKMPIAQAKIVKYADMLEAKTELLCPKCMAKPKWQGRYECECGSVYNHWSQLKRVLPSGKEIVKPKLTSGEDVEAEVYIMDKAKFSQYADATLTEYGIVVEDSNSANNLKKLIIALNNLNKVIILHFLDTYEERVACLTLSLSNRIVLKELIPLNLADIRDTMKADLTNITDKDIAEAEAFVKQLPEATEDEEYRETVTAKISIELVKVSDTLLQKAQEE